ncbi:MAG: 2-succinyl-6-hydroxy-2,4-cyclohexadiene-1-carboxy late synthase [Anaerolineae bacterium]
MHGFLGRGDDWLPIARALADTHYCLLPDLPGHGSHPPHRPLTFDTVTDGLARLLAARQIESLSLIGYSMGGRLALYYALKYPTHVQKLVLEGASPGLSAPAERQARAALDDDRAEQLRRHGIEPFVAQWYRAALFATLAARPHLLARATAQRHKNNARWVADVISALSPGRQPDLWPRLGHVSAPALLLAGELDAKFSELSRQMAARMPQARVALLPQAGHNTHLEQPAAFTAVVQQFLVEPPQARAGE